jgi:hypothetical protein
VPAHRAGVVALLAGLLALGCVRTRVGELRQDLGSGAVGVATLSVAGKEYHPSVCTSGDREYFRGVDLVDKEQGAVLRVLIDPMTGPQLRFSGGQEPGALFGAATCSTLAAAVQPSGWRVNRVRDVSGTVDAACRSESGVALRVAVTFRHCH